MTETRRNDLLMRLLDALESFYQHLSAVDHEGRRAFAEVAEWFESTDSSDEHCFEHLCAALELDPDRIRESLSRRSAEIRGARIAPRKR
jgi:hypothetical protein